MSYYRLLLTHPRPLLFGLANSFFSSLGQTHLVSLFGPFLMALYGLSNAEYGGLYSLATLTAGLTLPLLGPLIDRKNLRHFCLLIGVGLIFCEILLATSTGIFFIFISLFGLRLLGQGLCTQVTSVSTARYFEKNRGKALGITILGFPLAEGLLTPFLAFLVMNVDWQVICWLLAALVLLIYIPTVWFLTRDNEEFNKPSHTSVLDRKSTKIAGWTRRQVFSQRTIYLLLPQALMPPFALTGVLFHQAAIAELKGWTLAHIASGLVLFALFRCFLGFAIGPVVDRYRAVSLYPYYLLPLAVGLFILAFFNGLWAPWVAFGLFGMCIGAGGPIKSALWAELYGTLHLGAIKSVLATLMVVSTAASPALFGYILDVTGQSESLLMALALLTFIFSLVSALHLFYASESASRPGH